MTQPKSTLAHHEDLWKILNNSECHGGAGGPASGALGAPGRSLIASCSVVCRYRRTSSRLPSSNAACFHPSFSPRRNELCSLLSRACAKAELAVTQCPQKHKRASRTELSDSPSGEGEEDSWLAAITTRTIQTPASPTAAPRRAPSAPISPKYEHEK